MQEEPTSNDANRKVLQLGLTERHVLQSLSLRVLAFFQLSSDEIDSKKTLFRTGLRGFRQGESISVVPLTKS